MIVLTWVKDALLCLLICSALANMKKKSALVSLCIIIILFMMGIDI